ncbi:MAG: hypothetical protein GY865_17125, partial [candidate division Zixibacteria bacterium]|nr:hypothetical protein [candidate division Zixibacteria bacterium]
MKNNFEKMKKNSRLNISGGAKVHSKLLHSNISRLIAIPIILLLLHVSPAFAQGSIFGSITNSDATVPSNGEVTFYGFLDDTDEELRIETCIGAGYDAGNWFDDFQNYLTEAPGNPYDYYFYNTTNLESAVLSDLIPNNSFQQENIVLSMVAGWPTTPAGLSGSVVSSSSVVISWNYSSGLTYHIYRRLASSGGSFFRIDDPTGSLSNHGVADSIFVDNTSDGFSQYHYLVIAEDGLGNLSPHSNVLTVDAAAIGNPILISVLPNSGSFVGGTLVTLSGTGFDMNGADIDFGGSLMTSVTVVSPYEITGLTPAGTVGPVDVAVTNSAASFSSNILTGGFTYLGNQPPVLDPIGPQAITEGINLNFAVTASDPDAMIPVLSAVNLPGSATFVDNTDGTGTFDWTPLYTEAASYQVIFIAGDGIVADSEFVDIDVTEAGNQTPVLDPVTTPQTIAENNNLNFGITSSDPDGTIPTLSATGTPTNATFTDNLDGTGTFDFSPDYDQVGSYQVIFKAFDGLLVDSGIVTINVTNTNRDPVLAAIGPQAIDEGLLLSFTVSATDADGAIPALTTSVLPGTASFVDNGDGTGLFEWTPTFTEAGPYQVTFTAGDGEGSTAEIVDITVNETGNQIPILDPIGPLTAVEGVQLITTITGSDPDGTIPVLQAEDLPTNAVFVDNTDGTGTLTFDPDYSQAGLFTLLFIATDGVLSDSEYVDLDVSEVGNQSPIISDSPNAIINEGDSLIVVVTSSDPDGVNVILSASTTLAPSLFTFVDSGNGVGVFSLGSTYYTAGIDTVLFFATDFGSPPSTSTDTMVITINEVNQAPLIDTVGPFGVAVGDNLTFTVTSSDPTNPILTNRVFLSAAGLPANALFTDNGDNTGELSFDPIASQVGPHTVTIIATDMGSPQLSSQLPINITVVTTNNPPVWVDPPTALTVLEGEVLSFTATATDADGGFPVLSTVKSPENSTFTDNGDGTGTFDFTPGFVQSGLYQLVLSAYDGIADTRTNPIFIQVYEAGNQAPIFNPVPEDTVVEGNSIDLVITSLDPDATTPVLSAENLPENATFTDNGDGTGTINFNPSFVQNGTYYIDIIADDGEFIVSITVTVVVYEAGNQTPVLADIASQQTTEMRVVTFDVLASDLDLDIPILSATDVPGGATFTDNLNGSGTFNWPTDNFDAGTYDVTITATDALDPLLFDTKIANIVVADTNLVPLPYIPGQNRTVYEGDTLYYRILAEDPDGTYPLITVNSPTYELAPNMVWVDSGNGVGLLTFTPDYDQGGIGDGTEYVLQWTVTDSEDPALTINTKPPTQFSVINTNRPPEVLIGTTDTTITEGQELRLTVAGTDGDGDAITLWAENMPDSNVTFDGIVHIKTFIFTPDYTQSGVYLVDFVTSDGVLETRVTTTITVTEEGNQAPYFTMSLPTNQPVVSG